MTARVITRLTAALVAALLAAQPAAAQDNPPPGPDQRAYEAAMQRLARYPEDAAALRNAAITAVRLGELPTASMLAARADQARPENAWTVAVAAAMAAHRAEARAAVQGFLRAEAAGVDLAPFAAERGLAYDLAGDQPSAQFYYAQAQREGFGGDDIGAEATRRRALSLAISGEFAQGERLLEPLLAQQDRSAWRIRAFMLAIAGRSDEAVSVIETILPEPLAEAITPYLLQMPQLSRGQQAAAAILGLFPADGETSASPANPEPAPRASTRRRPGDDR